MNRCLPPGHLLCRGRRSFCSPHRSAIVRQQLLLSCLRRGPNRRQWSRPFSASVAHDPYSLRKYMPYEHPGTPVRGERQKDPNAWLALLEQYLTPSLPAKAKSRRRASAVYARAHHSALILRQARLYGNLDAATHLGFQLNRWPAVYTLLSQMVDATDSLLIDSAPRPSLSGFDWGSGAGMSFDELTGRSDGTPMKAVKVKLDSQDTSSDPKTSSLHHLTDRPYPAEFSGRIMAEVWQSLGSIVLEAADRPPNESKLAMSYVFRILARLHHSGAISNSVYKFAHPGPNQATFRPPGMHLLSTHIMSVLSETALGDHEAEVTAKAAAAGENSPYIPFNMGVRDLGPEIWLELILWCCVEHGHPREALWLLQQMKARTGDLAWSFQSWEPLLHDRQSVSVMHQTNVDSEEFWRRPDVPVPEAPKKRSVSSSFHGLAKRTISVEIVAAVRDIFFNFASQGLDHHGLDPTQLLKLVSHLNLLTAAPIRDEDPQPTTKENPEPTTKESNRFAVRFLESGILDPEEDPQAFDRFLQVSPHLMAPWDDKPSRLEEDLERLTPSQLYDDTSAFTGMIEYNIRFYCLQRQTGLAFSSFAWLQRVVDSSKLRHINKFLDQLGRSDPGDFPVQSTQELASQRLLGSSNPQVSNVTYAHLVDLATIARAFYFVEWLLYSNDLDGPPIRRSEFGCQALAPSLLRYAAVVKHKGLHNDVVSSLTQPFSVNTLRALITYRIFTGDWNRVVLMLEFVRDNRLKSWGHSNVTALASAILRLDHAVRHPNGKKGQEEKVNSLKEAKQILARIFNCEFNDLTQHTEGSTFQQRSLCNLKRVFMSIPGPLSEIASQAKIEPQPSHALPYIPSVAFHYLLSAVVDVHGSAAGKRLWERWCLDPKSPKHKRFLEGGNSRLYTQQERDGRKGDPHFNPAWASQLHRKAAVPNLNTVRIIAHKATLEYTKYMQFLSSIRQKFTDGDVGSFPPPPTSSISGYIAKDGDEIKQTLDFCMEQFRILRLPDSEIDREVQGHMRRVKKEQQARESETEIERQREKERIRRFMKIACVLE